MKTFLLLLAALPALPATLTYSLSDITFTNPNNPGHSVTLTGRSGTLDFPDNLGTIEGFIPMWDYAVSYPVGPVFNTEASEVAAYTLTIDGQAFGGNVRVTISSSVEFNVRLLQVSFGKTVSFTPTQWIYFDPVGPFNEPNLWIARDNLPSTPMPYPYPAGTFRAFYRSSSQDPTLLPEPRPGLLVAAALTGLAALLRLRSTP